MLTMRIAIITCYKDPEYVRAVTLRKSMDLIDNVDSLIIKNKHRGLIRYPEVIAKLIWIRLIKRPDAYLITFRGYEVLPVSNLITWPKPLIYDEFLNPLEWLNESRKESWARFIPQNFLKSLYRFLLRRPKLILADTTAHAKYSAKLLGLNDSKFMGLPVSTDESLFKPKLNRSTKSRFKVFYYGSMLGLHGLDTVLKATQKLKGKPIDFIIAGGGLATDELVRKYREDGSNLEYIKWIPYPKLPDYIHSSDITLGGPFGASVQAEHVITGKTYQFLACQSPVLIGQNKASLDFVDKVNCLSVPLGNHDALADSIEWAYKHPSKLEAIAKNGHDLYSNKFSNVAISKLLELKFKDLGLL